MFGKKKVILEANKMEEKSTKKWSDKRKIIFTSMAVILISSLIYMGLYDFFSVGAEAYYSTPQVNEENIADLFANNYILYRNLQNQKSGENISYVDLYLPELKDYIKSGNIEELEFEEITAENISDEMEAYIENVLSQYEYEVSDFDYFIIDHNSDASLSNTQKDLLNNIDNSYFYISIQYNSFGYPTIQNAYSSNNDSDQIFKIASTYANNSMNYMDTLWMEKYGHSFDEYFEVPNIGQNPKDCTIIYSLSNPSVGSNIYSNSTYYDGYDAYMSSGVGGYNCMLMIMIFTIALFLPLGYKEKDYFSHRKTFTIPVELIVFAAIMILSFVGSVLTEMIYSLQSGNFAETLQKGTSMYSGDAYDMSHFAHYVFLVVLVAIVWYLGLCTRVLREKGMRRYIKEQSITYQIFPFCKKKFLETYSWLEHFDVTLNARKTIFKIVLSNALILFVVSIFSSGGFVLTILYSIILYIILKVYISRMQRKYGILLSKINEIASGNLNVEINEDLGVFEPFKPQILRIQSGFRAAVDEEVKSQRMKSELITNVSHDLKTPLTAIITYVGLLKDENLTKEQHKEYLDTLERKSYRLKGLIEDLFEVSKANSGNVKMEPVAMDLFQLVRQVNFEFTDKLSEANLEVRQDFNAERAIVYLDSQKTYRIYSNLIGNIAKYALPGTRVYLTGEVIGETVRITFKNISKTELDKDISNLSERFVRGDASRNTEGSGLGLAIVKGFVELQGGKLTLSSDGDLFKVTTEFSLFHETASGQEERNSSDKH